MDVFALVIGFAIGVVVVSIAIEFGLKKTSRVGPASKHTKKWDISEISNPKIMAEYLVDAELPKNSKVVVNKCKDKNLLMGLNAKTHSGIRGNYIIGDDRVLILSGPVKKDEVGSWTVEEEIVEKLNQDFEEMWADGTKMEFEEKNNS
jgi:hypothetical protein